MKAIPIMFFLSTALLQANDTIYTSSGTLIKYSNYFKGINSIIQAKNGDIWIASQNGAWRHAGEEWDHYTVADGLGDNYVNSIYEDDSGRIWAGNDNQNGLNYFENSTWTNFKSGGSVPSYVFSICQGMDGKYYISGRSQSIYGDIFVYDGTNFTQLFLPWEGYDKIIKGFDNNLYVGTYSKLLKFDYTNWVEYFAGFYYLDEMKQRADGNFLITSNGGLKVFDGANFTTYTYSNTQGGLLSDQCYTIIEYQEDTFWIGTSLGICSFDGSKWSAPSELNSLLSTTGIEALYKDSLDNIWIADETGILYCYKPGVFYPNQISSALLTGNKYCKGDKIDYQITVRSFYHDDNNFIIQLSNLSQSFNNPINLTSVDTSRSIRINTTFPDSLVNSKQYLIRIKSTHPELYSFVDTIVYYPIPSSEFALESNELCISDTVSISYSGIYSENASFIWNFDNGIVVNNPDPGNYDVKWNSPGIKNISLSITENGCTSDSTQNTINVYQPVSTFTIEDVVCGNQSATVYFTGNASEQAAFYWDFNSANIISGSGAGPYVLNWDNFGAYNIALTIDDNDCLSSVYSRPINHNPIPTATITAPSTICFNNTAILNYIGSASNFANYNWNFNNGSVNSGTGPGPYEISWDFSGLKTIHLNVAENGCSSDTIIDLMVNDQTQPIPICLVSVDSSNHNLVVWEQPINSSIVSVFIYKETSQSNVYMQIGSQLAKLPSFFIDSLSNSAINSSKYRISVLDSCAYETEQSAYHKTLHLTINSGLGGAWNLIWERYEGFNYGTFNIYRGTSANSLFKIAEQASNTFTFTDLTPPIGTVYYQIEVISPNTCNIGMLKSSNDYYQVSRSNLVNSNHVTSLVEQIERNIEVWPNPTNDKLYIKSTFDFSNARLLILSSDGNVIVEKYNYQLEKEIDISKLNSGIYLLRLSNQENSILLKFVKL